jgi:hypothetical protein
LHANLNTKGEKHITDKHVVAENAILCGNLQFHDQKIVDRNIYVLHDGQTYPLVQVSMNLVATRGRLGLCIQHGRGKRYQVTNYTKSVEGYTCLCISHGDGHKLLIALKMLKATQVSAFHMVVVTSY